MTPLTVNELLAVDGQRAVVHHDGRLVCRCACGVLLVAHDNGRSVLAVVERHVRGERHGAWRARR